MRAFAQHGGGTWFSHCSRRAHYHHGLIFQEFNIHQLGSGLFCNGKGIPLNVTRIGGNTKQVPNASPACHHNGSIHIFNISIRIFHGNAAHMTVLSQNMKAFMIHMYRDSFFLQSVHQLLNHLHTDQLGCAAQGSGISMP